jgi:hypothetical protein
MHLSVNALEAAKSAESPEDPHSTSGASVHTSDNRPCDHVGQHSLSVFTVVEPASPAHQLPKNNKEHIQLPTVDSPSPKGEMASGDIVSLPSGAPQTSTERGHSGPQSSVHDELWDASPDAQWSLDEPWEPSVDARWSFDEGKSATDSGSDHSFSDGVAPYSWELEPSSTDESFIGYGAAPFDRKVVLSQPHRQMEVDWDRQSRNLDDNSCSCHENEKFVGRPSSYPPSEIYHG